MSDRHVLMLGKRKEPAQRALINHYPWIKPFYLSEVYPSLQIEPGRRLADSIDDLMISWRFDGVVATSESTMSSAGFLRSRYGWPGLTYDEVVPVTNKWRMRNALDGAVLQPRSWLSTEFSRLANYPDTVVLKPLESSSARNVRTMPAEQAKAWLVSNPSLWLVEEALVAERELHCDGIITDEEISVSEVSQYDCPVIRATGTRYSVIVPSSDPIRQAVLRATQKIVHRLRVKQAVFHIEFLETSDGLHLVEIALRPGGTGIARMLELAGNISLWRAFIASQLDLDPPPPSKYHAVRDLAGVIVARPSKTGKPPSSRRWIDKLEGIIATEAGNYEGSQPPPTICHYSYLAFFEGIDQSRLNFLKRVIGND